ncbi:MAG: response regulator transcription factor [Chloroflexi bacterium]|nr:response regulator transcription factor [Chloroflexota bacterium]
MVKTRVLVVDDELSIIKFLRANLEGKGYEVLAATNGIEALQTFETELPDLVLLDIMMPKMDGFEVCRRLREWSQTPIIMLSARGDESDKVKCLDLGADDYITKPFGASELIARVKAVMRRTERAATTPTQPLFISGDLSINFIQRRVTVAGKEVKLTPTEYTLLQELVLNAGKVLTHTHLLNKVWGPEYREEREYLHVFVRRLRAKLEPNPTNPIYIVTVPGVGYQFKDTA